MIFFMKAKRLFISFVVTLGVLVLALLVLYPSFDKQAKVDRTNAMQVVKNIMPDTALPVNAPDFFTEYRLEREKIRSERTELLRDTVKNARNDDVRNKAQETMLKIALDKQRESDAETLIKARGFADALVFLRESSVSAVIKTPSLTKEDVMQVADAIVSITGVKQEDITISAKP